MGVTTVSERALRLLLPKGLAWALGGHGGALIRGLAKSLERIRLLSDQVITESRPGTATELTMPEWHKAKGITYDPTKSLDVQRARLEAYDMGIGGALLSRLRAQVALEFDGITISEVSATSECGAAECGVAISGADENAHSYLYYDVTGIVDTDDDLLHLHAIFDRFAPYHLIPSLTGVQVRSVVVGSECGVALCGVSTCDGYTTPISPSYPTPPIIYEPGIPGTLLRIMPGVVDGGPTPDLSYQWLLNGSNISGATGTSYLVPVDAPSGDLYQCRITATNAGGSISAVSNTVTINGVAPSFSSLSLGYSGDYITVSYVAAGSPAPTLSYAWYKDGSLIPETTRSIAIAAHGAGYYYCSVTLTNTVGTKTQATNYLNIVLPSIASASISGSGGPGTMLSASHGAVGGAPDPALSYQWLLNGSAIANATGSTYTIPTNATVGDLYSCTITAANAAGSASATSNAIACVNIAPYFTSAPILWIYYVAALRQKNIMLACNFLGSPTPTVSYQWYKDGQYIGSSWPDALPGSYYVVITLTNAMGSVSQASNTLTI